MKTKKTLIVLFTALLQIYFTHIYAQTSNIKYPDFETVYLQTDRSVYIAGEPILFNAFNFSYLSNNHKPMSDTLLVALIDQDGFEVASGKFAIQGFSTKDKLQLSKYLTEGNYVLIAGTKRMKDVTPEKIFSRIIEIQDPKKFNEGIWPELNKKMYKPGEELTAGIAIKDKDNDPLATSFSWVLTGPNGDVSKGKGKTNGDGKATLETKLPEIQNNDSYKLVVSTSIKGDNIIAGIVVPTEDNLSLIKQWDKADQVTHLNITLSTDREKYTKYEEIKGYITVTSEQGKPLYANLSVSASDFKPRYFPLTRDNIITCSNLKNNDSALSAEWTSVLKHTNKIPVHEIINYKVADGTLFISDLTGSFGRALSQFIQTPGEIYLVQEKNNLKKIRKKQAAAEKAKQTGYSADRNIFDILRRIKPYQIVDGKIMFSNVGNFSVNFQNGALIVIDGVKMGTDVSVLSSLPVTEIARINATTNPSELQRYSALNSSGLIEITMKKGNSLVDKERAEEKKLNNSILWKPDLTTDTSGKASVSFTNGDKSERVRLTVQGITSDGLTGNCSVQYEVK